MPDIPVSREEIVVRLKKIEGQLRGIQNMVNKERQCNDVLMQLAAARSAIESVAVMVLKNYTYICMNDSNSDPNAEIARAVAMWVGGSSKR